MQVFNNRENIGDLTKLSATSVRLAPSVVTVGGQQFSTGILDCDLTTNGAGGLDTGSLANSTFYYVYVILDSGSPALIASTSEVKPLGFSTRFKVGAFYTDKNSEVLFTHNYLSSTNSEWESFPVSYFAGGNNLNIVSARWKRENEEIIVEFRGNYISSSSDTSISPRLPFDLFFDETKIRYTAGDADFYDSGSNDHYDVPTDSRNDATSGYFQMIFSSATPTPPSIASGDHISGYLRGSILGWVSEFDWKQYKD